jgi:amino acid permease
MIPIPVLWILFICALGLVGATTAYFLTQAVTATIFLVILGLIVMLVVWPVAPLVVKKLRKHAEKLEFFKDKTDESKNKHDDNALGK